MATMKYNTHPAHCAKRFECSEIGGLPYPNRAECGGRLGFFGNPFAHFFAGASKYAPLIGPAWRGCHRSSSSDGLLTTSPPPPFRNILQRETGASHVILRAILLAQEPSCQGLAPKTDLYFSLRVYVLNPAPLAA